MIPASQKQTTTDHILEFTVWIPSKFNVTKFFDSDCLENSNLKTMRNSSQLKDEKTYWSNSFTDTEKVNPRKLVTSEIAHHLFFDFFHFYPRKIA